MPRTVERKRRRRPRRDRIVRRCTATHHKSAAEREPVLLQQAGCIRREGRQSHTIGMKRQYLMFHEKQLHRLVEIDTLLSEQVQFLFPANALQRGFNDLRIDTFRIRALETDEHGSIRSMTHTRERKGTVQTNVYTRRALQQAGALQSQRKLARGAHRAHGMRTGRADSDLENVEYAQCAHWLNPLLTKASWRCRRPQTYWW